MSLPAGLEGELRAVAEGLELGAYRFTKYLTGDRKPKRSLASVTIGVAGRLKPNAKAALAVGQRVGGGGQPLARPQQRAAQRHLPGELRGGRRASSRRRTACSVQVFDFKEIRRRGMKLIDAVGRGSAREPRFVHISYTPKGAKRKLVFVGKGITFDTRRHQHQARGRHGRDEARHERRRERRRAHGGGGRGEAEGRGPRDRVAAPRTCPTANAYRPGDIWGSLDGKTVEIVNTDAEGRLVLADALAYARTLSPDLIVDNATLTGACMVALGASCSGWYASHEDAAREFAAAIKDSGESMWRMPLLEDLREQIKSDVADVKQTGDRYGGSITAALFLREFAGPGRWVHCDIAGPASLDRPSGWSQTKGATGHAVLTFLSLDRAQLALTCTSTVRTRREEARSRRCPAPSPTSR